MTDKEKIREEVERLKSNLIHGACSSQVAMEAICKEEAYNEVLAILDSLQEEPVSEDLKKAAEEYAYTNWASDDYHEGAAEGLPFDAIGHTEKCFKAGAKWQKEQMMAKAIDGYVIEDIEEGNGDFLLSTEYIPKSIGLKDQQKVKVIVIRED